MLVGALADAGADQSAITAAVQALVPEATVTWESVLRRGISATKFKVTANQPSKHRHLSGILKMIAAADIPATARARTARVFEVLGEAEAVQRMASPSRRSTSARWARWIPLPISSERHSPSSCSASIRSAARLHQCRQRHGEHGATASSPCPPLPRRGSCAANRFTRVARRSNLTIHRGGSDGRARNWFRRYMPPHAHPRDRIRRG